MKQYLILILTMICSTFLGYGQTVKVSGIVVDKEGRKVASAVIKVSDSKAPTFTNSKGEFKLNLNARKDYKLTINALNYYDKKLNFNTGSTDLFLGTITLTLKESQVIVVESDRTTNTIEKIAPPDLGVIPSGTGNFEDYIKLTGLGVSSNNDLTSNYNVRGGNYDENLIYVNGIEIYRPLLARSGQQEGLSFINSAFVDNIYFSAGGFDANYGDKLSSVLDVNYKEASEFKGSLQLSLLGAEFHVENTFGKGNRGNFITGARYRSSAYLLNSLPTKGDYFPVFFDYQLFANYYTSYDDPDRYQKIFFLGHYANNKYTFIPQTKTTQWGTVNEAYQLKIFFEGQEKSKFHTITGALGYQWKVSKKLDLKLTASAFNADENENYDILGEYWINTLETDPSKEEFGDSTDNIGVGGFLDHARNNLNTWIANINHTGTFKFDDKRVSEQKINYSNLSWGAKFQYEYFDDLLSEWSIIDSAGYLTPIDNQDLTIANLIKTRNSVENIKPSAFLQYTFNRVSRQDHIVSLKQKIKTDSSKHFIFKTDTISDSPAKWSFTFGGRAGLSTFNRDSWITPRGNVSYSPRSYVLTPEGKINRRHIKFRFSSGLYYQPPLYREMRDLFGNVNNTVISQKSWHNVLGMDLYIQMWGRPFKLVAETYYKHMWDINPYEIDNVKIRYYAKNNSVAYAYGFDAKINGEFIKGVESYFRLGLLRTREDLLDDDYYDYFNSDGEKIIPGFTLNDVPTDSTLISPGYIPRQTDQLITFSVFFQDKIPNYEDFKIAVNMQIGSPLPYGPPTFNRYQDILRARAYYRVDLGIIYDIKLKKNIRINPITKQEENRYYDRLSLSLNSYNLLDFKNVISFNWLQDISGRYYAIPNYLNGFRLNLKLVAEF